MAVLRREATSGWWGSRNPVLADGEFGVELDTGLSKIGDGSTAWNALSYSDELDEIDASPLGGSDGDLVGLDGQGGFKRVGSGTYRRATGLRTGNYYGSPAASLTTIAASSGFLFASPLVVAGSETLDRIAVEVTTAAGGSVVRLGLYDDDGNGAPSDLILDAGTVDSTSTGVKEITISQSVSGVVWLACAGQGGSPTLRAFSGGGDIVGRDSANLAVLYSGIVRTGVSGAFPATFGAVGSTATPPRVVVRAA